MSPGPCMHWACGKVEAGIRHRSGLTHPQRLVSPNPRAAEGGLATGFLLHARVKPLRPLRCWATKCHILDADFPWNTVPQSKLVELLQ